MSEKTSTDQYGRRTWNTEAYEEEARRSKRAKKEVSQESVDAVTSIEDKTLISQRSELLNASILNIKNRTLIGSENAGGGMKGRNKRFGFACPICDLSFRDTLALVDHFNSPQHLANIRKISSASGSGEAFQDGVQRASLEQVTQTLEELVKELLNKKAGADGKGLSLQERVAKRLEFEQKKAERKQEKKQKKLRKAVQGAKDDECSEVAALMGFGGFSSTKK